MVQKLVLKPGEVKGIMFTMLKDLKIQGVVTYYLLQITAGNHSSLLFF